MKVIPIPCLNDNFAYLVVCEASGLAGVVDPSEAPPVLRAVENAGVKLAAILNTHHHWDHIGGNKELLQKYPDLPVYGHVSDKGRIDGQTQFLAAGEQFSLGNLQLEVLHNPGHTSGAISYVAEGCVFTGDTLFAGGCGRIFEGTPEMMYNSLHEVIGKLPEDTKVYFGHEYTEENLRFAASVEPGNSDLEQRIASVRAARKQGGHTTPCTLAEEWRTNPFLRVDSPAIQQMVKKSDPDNDLSPVSVFAEVREMKNRF